MGKKFISIGLIFAFIIGLLPPLGFVGVKAADSPSAVIEASVQEIQKYFHATSNGVHPRVLAHEDDFLRIRENIAKDDYLQTCYARVYWYCEEQLSQPVSVYLLPDGTRTPNLCKVISQRVSWMAMLYKISGDGRFAERAITEMLAVSSFPTWKLGNYLDIAQIAYGVGLGYDWLYYEMTAQERSVISKALYEYAIKPAEGDWFKTLTSNWNPWCHGGVTIAACAIYEDYPTECAEFISGAVKDVQKSLDVLAPMGAYPEGPAYSQVGSLFSALLFESLETVLGTDFGLSETEGFREFGNYLPAMTGYVSSFNFGDGGEQILDGAVHHWFAKRFRMPELSLYEKTVQTDSWDEHLELLWYDPELVREAEMGERQLDTLLYSNEGQSVASFRSFEEDPYQIYAAIKSGYNSTSHADMDVGTFVLEAMGIRWFTDLGADNYSIADYGTFDNQYGYGENIGRWKVYRKRAEGQNTLVINPSERGGQDADAFCQITDYMSNYDGGYAVVDMLDAYDTYGVSSAKRGISLFDERTRVLIRDEITCSAPSVLYWFAHTEAEVAISPDGKTAELTQDGKTLLAKIVAPTDGKFTFMSADPLPTSPNISGQNSRAQYGKLAIHLDHVTSTAVEVIFTPILKEEDGYKEDISVSVANLSCLTTAYAPGTTLQDNNGIYEIRNREELICFSQTVNSGHNFSGKTVRLMADIDLLGRSMDPIGGGKNGKRFQGTFDGNNHIVENLCIFAPGMAQTGFFGSLYGATIMNFGIENGIVFGGNCAAGISGIAHNTTFKSCYNKATVIGNGAHIGGIVGQLSGVSGVTDCYNHGNVRNSASIAGGIVGYITSGATVLIENSYHAGTLSDASGRCGLIGFYNTKSASMFPKSITVRNSYSVTGLKCSEMVDVTGIEVYENSDQLEKGSLMSKAVALGDSFIDDCEQKNSGYPVLQWECDLTLPSNPVISTSGELRLLSYLVNSGRNSFYKQTVTLANDIDLGYTPWIPIGGNMPTDATGKSFSGTFDGRGYCVKNLHVLTEHYYVGFFGSVYGTIRNFGIESGYVKGRDKVGGITGHLIGTIEGCYNKATVEGNSLIGGLVGISGKSTFRNSYNLGSVSATRMAGGLVGYFFSAADGSRLTNCYNGGSISGGNPGQLVSNIHSAVTDIIFENCYATALPYVENTTTYGMDGGGLISQENLQKGANLLGKAYTYDTLRSMNGGYPILNVSLYHLGENPTLPKEADGIYHIRSVEDLYCLSYLVNVENQTFQGEIILLDRDLDLENRNWIPIGGNSSYNTSDPPAFMGTFRGRGHVIENLSVVSGNRDVGLFGYVYEGTLENLGIRDSMVIGQNDVGSLVGYGRSVVIRNCYNSACISGVNSVGGIAGVLSGTNSLIENCYNTASVLGDSAYGGILGTVGGRATNATIRNGYHAGPVGGILGSVTTGAVDTTLENLRSLTGNPIITDGSSATVTNSLFVTLDELRGSSASLGTAFAEDYLVQNRLLPVLQWENHDCKTTLPMKDGVYEISNGQELRLLSYLVRKGNSFNGKEIVLTKDIDLEREPWLPIGGYDESRGYAFLGSFDGRGYIVSNMHSVDLDNNGSGLFGRVYNGTVKNVGLENSLSISKQNAAGLVANLEKASKVQCSYTTATVFGNSNVGGLVAIVGGPDCLVENCYNTGFISAQRPNKFMAGLIGYLSSSAKNMTIQNCYNVGNFYGIIGLVNASASNNVVKNTYSAGSTLLFNLKEALLIQSTVQVPSRTLKGYAVVLGDAFDSDILGKNQGYPVLTWQSGKLCFHSLKIASDGVLTHTTTCNRCGMSTTEDHAWDAGITVTEATCTNTGTKKYTCGVCGDVKPETIAAMGHSYSYTWVNMEYHNISCANCSYFATSPHVYKEKECICGQVEISGPIEEPNWKIGHTLNLASDISINLAVSKDLLAGFDMDTVYINAEIDIYNGNEKIGVKTLKLLPTQQGNYYYFTITGLTAVHMNDLIRSVLHGTKDGREYCSPVDTYSIATYAYSQLNKEGVPTILKTLCADLLRYGTYAQIYKGYRTDALADSAMSDAHGAYLSDIDSVTFGNTNLYLNDLENAPVTWVGKALNLDSKVELKFIFNVKNYPADCEDLNLQVAYTDVKGNPKTVTVDHCEVYNESLGYYSFTLDALLAAELRSVVSVQIYAEDTPVSCTLQYTADTYGNNKTGALGDLCKALFAYSDSAKNYFNG